MSRWVIRGLRTGVVTTRYPAGEENTPGTSPGLPQAMACDNAMGETLLSRCPMGALIREDDNVAVNQARCIHCYRCSRGIDRPIHWDPSFEWAKMCNGAAGFPRTFQRSLHVRIVDAGDCGACLNEAKLLNNPFYNMHRLGFFITPTPRQADVLLVVGPVTDHMKTALLKAYEAMPTPRRVVAVGSCALSGGVFGPGFMTGSGVGELVPVDVEIPGCPPPPLAILHGLLVLAGRKTAPGSAGPVPHRAKEGGDPL